jgi:LuxR family quorum sensing-dependent transcriptional regulator
MGTDQTITRIMAAGRQGQVMEILAAAGRRHGYSVVALGAPPRGKDFDGYFLFFSTWPQTWFDLGRREGLVADDPMALAAAVNPMPFLWSDLVAGRVGLTLTEAQMRAPRLAAEHGWREGLCVPIHGPGATVAPASFGGRSPDTSLGASTELHILTLHAHVRLSARSRRTGRLRDGAAPLLTAREAEALA